ncbi:MAG: hypothetical protein AABX00_05215 [Nanoarchaeota archaeon]
MSITPEGQLSLKPGEKAEYKVLITAPSYFIEGTHQLTFDISGKLVYGFVTEESVIEMERDVAYEKVITLKILEMDRKAAEIALINAQGLITDMRIKGYNVETVKPILALVEDAYKKDLFGEMSGQAEKIEKIFSLASAADAKISSIKSLIETSKERYIEVSESERSVNLAIAAFERGNFELASQRAEEAELVYASEVKGVIPIKWYLTEFKLQILGAFAVLMMIVFLASVSAKRTYLKHEIRKCQEEEDLLLGLIKEVQRETFEKNSKSIEEYNEALNQYEGKLADVLNSQLSYENRLAHLITFTSKHKMLLKEKEKIISKVKSLQTRYIETGMIDTRIYQNRVRSLSERLAEIEENIASEDVKKAMRRFGGGKK